MRINWTRFILDLAISITLISSAISAILQDRQIKALQQTLLERCTTDSDCENLCNSLKLDNCEVR